MRKPNQRIKIKRLRRAQHEYRREHPLTASLRYDVLPLLFWLVMGLGLVTALSSITYAILLRI